MLAMRKLQMTRKHPQEQIRINKCNESTQGENRAVHFPEDFIVAETQA